MAFSHLPVRLFTVVAAVTLLSAGSSPAQISKVTTETDSVITRSPSAPKKPLPNTTDIGRIREAQQVVRDTATISFASGNVVVCRIGTGAAALSNAATEVFLDEYTPSGTFVSSLALPTASSGLNEAITMSGTTASECQLTRSADRRYLIVVGYAALPGLVGVSGTAAPRTFARVDANGTINTTSTTTSFGTSIVKSAASNDGSGFWAVGGSVGVVYVPLGGAVAGTVVSNTIPVNRVINIFNGQLYTSDSVLAVRIGTVGTGMPTSTGETVTNIPGMSSSTGTPNGFFFADLDGSVSGLDTLYVADEGTGIGAGGGGVKKYSLVSGNWTYNGTFPASTTPAIPASTFFGLAGSVSGTMATLFATRLSTAGNQLVRFVDATGYNAAPTAVPTLLTNAAANTVFRGVAMAPQFAPTAANVPLGGRVLTADGFGLKGATVTLEGGNLTSPRTVLTGPFGYYQFSDLPVGLTYVMTIKSKRYSFVNPTRVVNLDAELLTADFTAEP